MILYHARSEFQCSSASRKFLNGRRMLTNSIIPTCFSALQRAENSSIYFQNCFRQNKTTFQCSSASRKFLNQTTTSQVRGKSQVSVLFSEPKIPQSLTSWYRIIFIRVSVLFSEPKIPQFGSCWAKQQMHSRRFSALQRAENSSIPYYVAFCVTHLTFRIVHILVIEEFSARWRALKLLAFSLDGDAACGKLRNFRLAEEHWNMILLAWTSKRHYDWGIFGSLKSTETSMKLSRYSLSSNRLRNFRLAEEHWNVVHVPVTIATYLNWGIFGSLKSTETLGTSAPDAACADWGIFGSLKSTETV